MTLDTSLLLYYLFEIVFTIFVSRLTTPSIGVIIKLLTLIKL